MQYILYKQWPFNDAKDVSKFSLNLLFFLKIDLEALEFDVKFSHFLSFMT